MILVVCIVSKSVINYLLRKIKADKLTYKPLNEKLGTKNFQQPFVSITQCKMHRKTQETENKQCKNSDS